MYVWVWRFPFKSKSLEPEIKEMLFYMMTDWSSLPINYRAVKLFFHTINFTHSHPLGTNELKDVSAPGRFFHDQSGADPLKPIVFCSALICYLGNEKILISGWTLRMWGTLMLCDGLVDRWGPGCFNFMPGPNGPKLGAFPEIEAAPAWFCFSVLVFSWSGVSVSCKQSSAV